MPAKVGLAVHVSAATLPPYSALELTSRFAALRSLAVGATPASERPPLKVAVTVPPAAAHTALVVVMEVGTHAPTAVAVLEPDCQPALTVPAGQTVHVEEPSAQLPDVSVAKACRPQPVVTREPVAEVKV
jgi:hypothetical protein